MLAASLARLGRVDEAGETARRLLELDPELTIVRLQRIYPVPRYRNLDGFVEGLRSAGLPD